MTEHVESDIDIWFVTQGRETDLYVSECSNSLSNPQTDILSYSKMGRRSNTLKLDISMI